MPSSVLIAEDDIAIREALAHFLVDEGYRVHVADGREALDYAVLHHPELIVSDIKMPWLHGFALVEHLRRGERRPDRPDQHVGPARRAAGGPLRPEAFRPGRHHRGDRAEPPRGPIALVG